MTSHYDRQLKEVGFQMFLKKLKVSIIYPERMTVSAGLVVLFY